MPVIVALVGWFIGFDVEKSRTRPLGISLRSWALFVLIVIVLSP